MKTRIVTALLLLPIAVAAVWYLPNGYFAILIAAMIGVGAWEWAGLAQLGKRARPLYIALIWLLCAAAWRLSAEADALRLLLAVAGLWWLAATAWVLAYPAGLPQNEPRRLLVALAGVLALVPAFVALARLQGSADGPLRVLSLFGLIWAADTGAYFAGRSLGRRKLAPAVSPGKTWEGLAGGMLASAVLALVAAWLLKLDGARIGGFLALAAVTVAVSVIGDLTESMFKRHAGLKDSGGLFPGHGGMLDRADSMLAAAPCYLLGLMLLGI